MSLIIIYWRNEFMRYLLNLFRKRKNDEDDSTMKDILDIADVLVADVNFRQTMQLVKGGIVDE